MPNFTKSKGFQLKSGNTAKAPFKMMGSSPAKQVTAEADSTSVKKPITPKIHHDQNTPDQPAPSEQADYAEDFFKKSSKGKTKGKALATKTSVKKPVEKKRMMKSEMKPIEKKSSTQDNLNKNIQSGIKTEYSN